MFLVTEQAGVCGYRSGETASCTVVFVMIYYFTMAGVSGYRSGWCLWLPVRLVFLVSCQAGVSGYRSGWCFLLQIRLVFLVTEQAGVSGYRPGWCFWLQVRLVFVVTDQAGVCGYRPGWCLWLQVRRDSLVHRGVRDDLLLHDGGPAVVRHAVLRLARDVSRAGHTT